MGGRGRSCGRGLHDSERSSRQHEAHEVISGSCELTWVHNERCHWTMHTGAYRLCGHIAPESILGLVEELASGCACPCRRFSVVLFLLFQLQCVLSLLPLVNVFSEYRT